MNPHQIYAYIVILTYIVWQRMGMLTQVGAPSTIFHIDILHISILLCVKSF